MAAPGTLQGVAKALDKIKTTVESGSYYEAQQMYKTVYHRYRNKRQLKDSYQILQAGAIQQLSKSQATCGVELGLLLVEALTQDQVEPEGEALQGVCDMLRALPPPASRSDVCVRDSAAGQAAGPSEDDTALEEYARLVAAAAKWAAGKGKCSPAACHIHDIFGAYLMQQHGLQQLGRATQHFARGSQPKEYAKVICKVAALGKDDERDMFVAHAVLHVLATAHKGTTARHWQHAKALLAACLEEMKELNKDEDEEGEGLKTALISFLHLLLQALQLKSLPLFLLLEDRYDDSLALDPSYTVLLGAIRRVYLGARPGGLGGALGGLLSGLLGGGMGGEEEDEEEGEGEMGEEEK